MNDWRSKPRNGKAEFVKHLDTITSRIAAGETQVAIYNSLRDGEGLSLSASQFNRYIQKLVTSEETVRAKRANDKAPIGRTSQVGAKLDLLSGGGVKPQPNFRQSMKQIRDEVENTDWAKLIDDSKRPTAKG